MSLHVCVRILFTARFSYPSSLIATSTCLQRRVRYVFAYHDACLCSIADEGAAYLQRWICPSDDCGGRVLPDLRCGSVL